MAQLIQRAINPQVFIDASTIDLVGDDLVAEFEPDWTHNGLLDAAPAGDAVRILCGQEIGTASVTAELWDGPPQLNTGDWQDIAELSVVWPSSLMDFGTTGSNGSDMLELAGADDYRVRVYGRNRDGGDPRDDTDPVEEYLIQTWPAAPPNIAGTGTAVTYKQTSQLGTRYREER
ncbi:hypothetical protein AB0I10_40710 [Streptomyces sp. NPDC050636]|uniref:hypothetical protein n=1 Tax=Streptomyces sp. NPDC050636 TaxID=3154510 RepID=UPI003440F1BC